MNNYMVYPLKDMRITCRYDEASHKKHNTNVVDGNIDYPIDDGGKDTGRDPIYCPCDEMKVTAIRGVGNANITNTVWLVSTAPVITPTFTDIAYLVLTHSNDSDFMNMKVGDTFKRREIICYEGTSGTTSNHIHLVCGRGYCDNWRQNSNGSWIMTGDNKKPEDVFFIDRSFTDELWGGYLPWRDLPKKEKVGNPVTQNDQINQVEVLVDNLNARSDATIESSSLGYMNRGIYNILDTKENEGYTWVKIENYWIATHEEWTKYYPKKNTCKEELEFLKKEYPKLVFTCNQTGKYIIYLEKGKKLYLK